MRVGRPEQQSNIIRHLAHEFATGAPCDVSPVPDSRERGSSRVGYTTQHLQMSIFACDTPVSLIVVDHTFRVFRMHVYPELGQLSVLLR